MAQPPPRTAVITGGAGFVGLHIVEELARAGWFVLSLDRSPADSMAVAVARRWAGRITFLRCDVRDDDALRTATATRDVAVAVHAAAVTSAQASDSLAMVDVHIRATQVLLDLVREGRIGRLIVLSSAGVFRTPESAGPLAEDDPVTLNHPYAITKVAAERLVAVARQAEGADAVAVRLPFVYGPYERPTRSRTGLSSICRAVGLARAGQTIRVNGPDVLRDWTHAQDIATGIAQIASHRLALSSLYHLGIGTSYTMRETIEQIQAGVPGSRVEWVATQEEANVPVSGENRRSALGIERARTEIGFTPRLHLAEGIRAYLHCLDCS